MTMIIRPIRVDEAESWRDLRLEALRSHPEAFTASYEHEAAQPLGFFEERLKTSVIFGGFREQELLGTAGFAIQAGPKRRHKGTLWGMYVRPAARGTGLAPLLVLAVLDHAREHVELIQLSVVADNHTARRLYASMGFEPYGIEERALKVDGRYFDDLLMAKRPP
jgi:RimJ/RimL family protein N-acetyltransferase